MVKKGSQATPKRQRFAALAPASSARANRRGPASSGDLAALCTRGAEGFTQLPVQRVEQSVKPTQGQEDAFEKLKVASTDAANQLQASCPTETPQAPIDRFDAVGKRLDAMASAIKTVRPALANFYASLTDEQKARFNRQRLSGLTAKPLSDERGVDRFRSRAQTATHLTYRQQSPRIAQLILCNDLAIGCVYAMKLPTARAQHRFVVIAIS